MTTTKQDLISEQAIKIAAERLGAKKADVYGYYQAGKPWEADTVDELVDLICECWAEQEKE